MGANGSACEYSSFSPLYVSSAGRVRVMLSRADIMGDQLVCVGFCLHGALSSTGRN